jgi:hypothetical protein
MNGLSPYHHVRSSSVFFICRVSFRHSKSGADLWLGALLVSVHSSLIIVVDLVRL